jgi:hypothetical protein
LKRLAISAALVVSACGLPDPGPPEYPAPGLNDVRRVATGFYVSGAAFAASVDADVFGRKIDGTDIRASLRSANSLHLVSLDDCRWETFDPARIRVPKNTPANRGYRCSVALRQPVFNYDCVRSVETKTADFYFYRHDEKWRVIPNQEWAFRQALGNQAECRRKAEQALEEEIARNSRIEQEIARRKALSPDY